MAIEETLKQLDLVNWEREFILRHSGNSLSVAIKMAADHIIRNSILKGEDIAQYQKKFLDIGVTVRIKEDACIN